MRNYVLYGLTGDYLLQMWIAGDDPDNRRRVGYMLQKLNDAPLFIGERFKPSPMVEDSLSIESAQGLLGFLTLKPGDTDAEYFRDYNGRQMEFAETEAETCGWEWVHNGGIREFSATYFAR